MSSSPSINASLMTKACLLTDQESKENEEACQYVNEHPEFWDEPNLLSSLVPQHNPTAEPNMTLGDTRPVGASTMRTPNFLEPTFPSLTSHNVLGSIDDVPEIIYERLISPSAAFVTNGSRQPAVVALTALPSDFGSSSPRSLAAASDGFKKERKNFLPLGLVSPSYRQYEAREDPQNSGTICLSLMEKEFLVNLADLNDDAFRSPDAPQENVETTCPLPEQQPGLSFAEAMPLLPAVVKDVHKAEITASPFRVDSLDAENGLSLFVADAESHNSTMPASRKGRRQRNFVELSSEDESGNDEACSRTSTNSQTSNRASDTNNKIGIRKKNNGLEAISKLHTHRDRRSLRRAFSPTNRMQLKRLNDDLLNGDPMELLPRSPGPYSPPPQVIWGKGPPRRRPRGRRLKHNRRANNEMEKEFLYADKERREWNKTASQQSDSSDGDPFEQLNQIQKAQHLGEAADAEAARQLEEEDARFVANDDSDEDLASCVEKAETRRRAKQQKDFLARHRSRVPRCDVEQEGPANQTRRGKSAVTWEDMIVAGDVSPERARIISYSSSTSGSSSSEAESERCESPVQLRSVRKSTVPKTIDIVNEKIDKRKSCNESSRHSLTPKRKRKLLDAAGNCLPSTSAYAAKVAAEEEAEARAHATRRLNNSRAKRDENLPGDVENGALNSNASSVCGDDDDDDSEEGIIIHRSLARRSRITSRQRANEARLGQFRSHRDAVECRKHVGTKRQTKKLRKTFKAKQAQLAELASQERRSHRAFVSKNDDDDDDHTENDDDAEPENDANFAAMNRDRLQKEIALIDQKIRESNLRQNYRKRKSRTLVACDDGDIDTNDDAVSIDGENLSQPNNAARSNDDTDDDIVVTSSRSQIKQQRSNDENNPAYEVESIIRLIVPHDSDDVFYEIKWKNYPHDQNTEEPSSCLFGCMPMLQEFRRQLVERYPSVLTYEKLSLEKDIPTGEYLPAPRAAVSSTNFDRRGNAYLRNYNLVGEVLLVSDDEKKVKLGVNEKPDKT